LINHIGVSNFTLEECKRSKDILESHGLPLYGVQNHYSIICRDWEKYGLLGIREPIQATIISVILKYTPNDKTHEKTNVSLKSWFVYFRI